MEEKVLLGCKEIKERLKELKSTTLFADDIGYSLLYAFGKSERDLARYKDGEGVLKTFDGLPVNGLLYYRGATTLQIIDDIECQKSVPLILRNVPSILAVSDGMTLLAYAPKENDTYENLYFNFAFFYHD